jgi:hypothetical protein
VSICIFAGQPLTKWRNYLEKVIDTINYHQAQDFKSMKQLFLSYFSGPRIIIPQSNEKLYAFNINDKVVIDAFPHQRRSLSFKYSLNKGYEKKNFFFTKVLIFFFFFLGKLQNKVEGIIQSRKIITKNNVLIPIYTVFIPKLNQVMTHINS